MGPGEMLNHEDKIKGDGTRRGSRSCPRADGGTRRALPRATAGANALARPGLPHASCDRLRRTSPRWPMSASLVRPLVSRQGF